MNKQEFSVMEQYMLSCMDDSAHDAQHIYRVLHGALVIARSYPQVDMDVLIAACLLHDIGRREQFADPKVCHAEAGSEKAYCFLTENGYSHNFADHVRRCILTHRFRKNMPPQTMEAKILFDADKLDVTGAVGIARTLMYKGDMTEPLYLVLPDGSISDGTDDAQPSFFREYKFKLEKLYDRFFTPEGVQLAQHRRSAAEGFYESLYREVSTCAEEGRYILGCVLCDATGDAKE